MLYIGTKAYEHGVLYYIKHEWIYNTMVHQTDSEHQLDQ